MEVNRVTCRFAVRRGEAWRFSGNFRVWRSCAMWAREKDRRGKSHGQADREGEIHDERRRCLGRWELRAGSKDASGLLTINDQVRKSVGNSSRQAGDLDHVHVVNVVALLMITRVKGRARCESRPAGQGQGDEGETHNRLDGSHAHVDSRYRLLPSDIAWHSQCQARRRRAHALRLYARRDALGAERITACAT